MPEEQGPSRNCSGALQTFHAGSHVSVMVCGASRAMHKQYVRIAGGLHDLLRFVETNVPPSAGLCVALLVVELEAEMFDMALAKLRRHRQGLRMCCVFG